MIRIAVFTLIFSIFFWSCAMKISKTDNQGINGRVVWHEGNQMPSPDASATNSQGQPVERLIYIFQRTTTKDVAPDSGPIYENINSELVKVIPTDHQGRFRVVLPPGKYSLFTKEDNGFFANKMDGQNNINPVDVNPKKFTEVTIDINYKASY